MARCRGAALQARLTSQQSEQPKEIL